MVLVLVAIGVVGLAVVVCLVVAAVRRALREEASEAGAREEETP